MGLYYILQHLHRSGTHARILFVDFSSAFNSIIPDILLNKLTQLSVPPSSVSGSPASDRQQRVRLGNSHLGPSPSALVLLRVVYSPHCSSHCTPTTAPLNTLCQAPEVYRRTPQSSASSRTEKSLLTDWRLKSSCCLVHHNNLELITLKSVEMMVDFRRNTPALFPLTLMNSTVESFRVLVSTSLST